MNAEHNNTICKIQSTLTSDLGEVSTINTIIINVRTYLNSKIGMLQKIESKKIENMSTSQLLEKFS